MPQAATGPLLRLLSLYHEPGKLMFRGLRFDFRSGGLITWHCWPVKNKSYKCTSCGSRFCDYFAFTFRWTGTFLFLRSVVFISMTPKFPGWILHPSFRSRRQHFQGSWFAVPKSQLSVKFSAISQLSMSVYLLWCYIPGVCIESWFL